MESLQIKKTTFSSRPSRTYLQLNPPSMRLLPPAYLLKQRQQAHSKQLLYKKQKEVTNVRITSGGMTAAKQLIIAPTIPAALNPAKAERLMAIAPGVDCATAAIFIKSSSEKYCFLTTKNRRTIGTTT